MESEKHGYSKKHKFAGIIDSIATINKKLTLLDFKTSSGVYPEQHMQAGAYKLMYEEMTGRKIEETIILHLNKKTGEFKTYKVDDIVDAQKSFLSMINIVKYIDAHQS